MTKKKQRQQPQHKMEALFEAGRWGELGNQMFLTFVLSTPDSPERMLANLIFEAMTPKERRLCDGYD